MKVAIVGKGGSGKSSVSWLLSQTLCESAANVLAVDADYNMDLAYCLGVDPSTGTFINEAEADFYEYQKLTAADKYVDLSEKESLRPFSLNPVDEFTEKYSKKLSDKLRLMVCGTTQHSHRYSHRCSHAYISSLKYYLPWLKLAQDEAVVCDSVAGTDMVAYGLYLGVDVMVTVIEDTPQSIGVFSQIDTIAKEFGIPHRIVRNKVGSRSLHESVKSFLDAQGELIIGEVPFDGSVLEYNFKNLSDEVKGAGQEFLSNLKKLRFSPDDQWVRHQEWYRQYTSQLKASKEDPMNFVTENAGQGALS